jgi:hypothetical protein
MKVGLMALFLAIAAAKFTSSFAEESASSTSSATIKHPYDDPIQQAIPFGIRSFYLAPWRAYMDTWSADQFLNCLGINFNVGPEDAAATARVLADAGFRSARVELGWGNLDYTDPEKINTRSSYEKVFRALHQAGIRPLILLNANSGQPVPFRRVRVVLSKPALKGARAVFFDRTDGIRPGYTGFGSLLPQRFGFPLITAIEPSTGRCELSGPLPKDLPAGPLDLADLKYHPFSGDTLADGTLNPWGQETIEGWKTYVRSVCKFAKEALGTEGQTDAGFDLEVWNELTFGSDFLDEQNYYEPKRSFQTEVVYRNHGLLTKGPMCILPITVDYVNDPKSDLRGVRVINGFSNQWPWDSGSTMWPGQAGFSRHFYTSLNPDTPFNGVCGFLSPQTNDRPGQGPINALGFLDGQRDLRSWHTVVPGSYFTPTLHVSMPEAWQYGYKIEYLTRDVQPFPGLWDQHFRFSNPGDGHPAEFWMTETNTPRSGFLSVLQKQLSLPSDDPALVRLSHHLGAKATLRTFVFQSSKGVHTIELYAARGQDLGFAVIPEAFFSALKKSGHILTEEVRGQSGEQLSVLARVAKLMQQGKELPVTRPLGVSSVTEHDARLVSKGDGTPEHPDQYNRDDFAVLPFQLASNRFAVGYYVVTRDMTSVCRPELDPLDPARYDMRPQLFDVTLTNVVGENATVSAFDPFTDGELPVRVLDRTATTLTVQLQTVDYPRFLIINEADPGLTISQPKLAPQPDGSAKLSFDTDLPATAKLSWGAWPQRDGNGSIQLAAATHFDYSIPHLVEHEAVQIRLERDGLVVPWPRWQYDVAGVLWPTSVSQENGLNAAQPPLPRLPALPIKELPDSYQTQLPAGLKWKDERGVKILSIGSTPMTIRASLFVVTDAAAAPKLLPSISVRDDCRVRPENLNGALAWRAEVKLTCSGYPNDPDTDKIVYIVPTKQGWLEIKFEGNQGAIFANEANIQTVLSGIRFTYNGPS